MKKILLYTLVIVISTSIFLISACCRCPTPPPHKPYPAAVWVPGHYGPRGHWIPGHWK